MGEPVVMSAEDWAQCPLWKHPLGTMLGSLGQDSWLLPGIDQQPCLADLVQVWISKVLLQVSIKSSRFFGPCLSAGITGRNSAHASQASWKSRDFLSLCSLHASQGRFADSVTLKCHPELHCVKSWTSRRCSTELSADSGILESQRTGGPSAH